MIEFVTFLLGFIAGVQPVEVAVDDAVAAVVLRLDGREAARLEAPPWTAEVDFGPDLEPHRLEAVALDAAGRALGEARQLVNYLRSDYAATVVLDPSPAAGRRGGRVLWAAVLDQDPVRVALRFDGRPLDVEVDGRFLLPPHDPQVRHSLAAELTFPSGHVARAELAFGGVWGDRVTSALTAVPVTSPPGRPWSPEEVRGWLAARDGRPLEVFAAGAEEGTIVVVRDEDVVRDLRRLRDVEPSASAAGVSFDVTVLSTRPLKAHANTYQLVRLGRTDDGMRLASWLRERRLFSARERLGRRQRRWEAVALAGRHAAASNRPRAVLLLTAVGGDDSGAVSASAALHYLESVRVPLYVWAPRSGIMERLGLRRGRTAVGEAGFADILRRLREELASQTVVWVEGEYLPSEVELGEVAPEGVELVR